MKAIFVSTKGDFEQSEIIVNDQHLYVIDEFDGEDRKSHEEFDVELYCYQSSINILSSQSKPLIQELINVSDFKYVAKGKIEFIDDGIFIVCGQIKIEIESHKKLKIYKNQFLSIEIEFIHAFEKYIPTKLDIAITEYQNKNYSKSFQLFKPLALDGDQDAQYYYACSYYYARGIEKDLRKASNWFEKSATAENIKAQNFLSYIYCEGVGVKKSYAKARMWAQAALNNGSIKANTRLGYIYLKGLGVKVNFKKAYLYFQAAAEYDESYALLNLGVMYEHGTYVKQDFDKAAELYQKSANYNNGQASYNLGLAYLYGRGVIKNKKAAKKYMAAAVEKGIEDAVWFINNKSDLFDD